MEVLTAYCGEVDAGTDHQLSGQLLMAHAPSPMRSDVEDLATLAAMLVALLGISVQTQAALATVARQEAVSVDDILASLGSAIERATLE